MIKYDDQFLRKMKAIKSYLVGFEENNSIKLQFYFKDYIIRDVN